MVVDYAKYPFLKPLEEELNKYAGGVTLDFILSTSNNIKEEAKKRVNKILKDEELEPYDKINEPVLVFYTTLYLVVALDNELLKKKFVEREAELIEKELKNEKEEVLLEIANYLNSLSDKFPELASLRINPENLLIKRKEKKKTLIVPFKFSMNFIDYLKVTKDIRKEDEDFSLSARILKDGKVFLTKDEVVKILTYKIKDLLYEAVNIKYESIPEEVKKMAEELKGRRTPPCIQALLNKKELGEVEKAVLVTYFLDIGDYKNAERFSEDLAKKYRGDKKTKYIVYSCSKMKELGLCVNSCGTSNPLQHYYGKASLLNSLG